MGIKVIHGTAAKEWTGKDDEILVNGKPLWEFISEMKDPKYKLLKDQVILITRMFDYRVKSFIKNIIMGNGKDKLDFEYYSYRIEFQGRGLPHLHGALWLSRIFLDKYFGLGKTLQESDDTQAIIEHIVTKLISCEIPQPQPGPDERKLEELKKKVLELQTHKHTGTCTKRGTTCRFDFPRYPSDKILISEPAENKDEWKNLDEEKRKEKLEHYKKILEKVKIALEDEELDDTQTVKNFLKNLDIKEEEYYKALETSQRGRVLVLKRTLKERNVNNYNKEWLTAWVSISNNDLVRFSQQGLHFIEDVFTY